MDNQHNFRLGTLGNNGEHAGTNEAEKEKEKEKEKENKKPFRQSRFTGK